VAWTWGRPQHEGNLILALALGTGIVFAVTATVTVAAASRATDASAKSVKAGFSVAQQQKVKRGCPAGTRWAPREKRCVPA
jgi:hypothetical protein